MQSSIIGVVDKYPSESKTARLLETFWSKAANVLDRVDMRAIHTTIPHQFMDPIQERWNPPCRDRAVAPGISEPALLDDCLVDLIGVLGAETTDMERGRVVGQLREASEGEVGVRRSHMVDSSIENEVHSTFMQSAAKLFQAIGGAKMGIQGIEFLRPITGAHRKLGT